MIASSVLWTCVQGCEQVLWQKHGHTSKSSSKFNFAAEGVTWQGGSSYLWPNAEVKCGSADITIPLSPLSSCSSLSYLSSTVLSSSPLISLSISSLFTAYLVWSLPTLTALQSFIKPMIKSTHTNLHTDTHSCTWLYTSDFTRECLQACINWTVMFVCKRLCKCIHIWHA